MYLNLFKWRRDSGALVSIAKKEFNFNINSFSIIENRIRDTQKKNIDTLVKDCGCNLQKLIYQKLKTI